MYPVINIFGITIGSYGLFSVLGLICAVALCTLLGKKRGVDFDTVLLLMLAVGGGILVGGHLMYGLTHIRLWPQAFRILFSSGFYNFCVAVGLMFGGMVYYGGFIGSVIAVLIYTHYHKALDRKLCLDLLGVATPLFHVFGRVGCFFSGCCYGAEADWGVLITDNTLMPSINGVPRIPIALIEAGCNLLIFLALLIIFLRFQGRSFSLLGCYVFLYAPTRFVTEMFRGDEVRGAFLWFSTSQWISLLLFVAALICLGVWLVRRRREKLSA